MSPVILSLLFGLAVVGVLGLAVLLDRRFTVKFGNLEASVEGTHQLAREINQAVNHRPPGDPTLYEQTAECRRTLDGLRDLPPKVDRLGRDLRSHLDWHDGRAVDVAD